MIQARTAENPRAFERQAGLLRWAYRPRLALWLFVVALVVRLALLGVTFRGNETVKFYDDAKIAINLVAGNGYAVDYTYRNFLLYEAVMTESGKLDNPITAGTRTTALKQPVYALFLAAVFWLAGTKNFLAVFLIHAVISSLTVSFLYLILKRASPLSALIVALGAIFYPPFMGHPVTVPESTTLHLFLIASLVLCLVKIREQASAALWALSGALGAIAILTEPIMMSFVGIALAYAAYLDRRELRVRATALAMSLVVMAMVLAPWLIRNYLVFDRFPLLKTGAMGHIFVWGLKYSGSGSWIPDEKIIELEKAGRALNEVEEEDAIQREVMASFPNHWVQYVTKEIPQHFAYLWWDTPDYWSDYSLRYLAGRRIPFLLLLCLALPQMWRTAAGLLKRTRQTLLGEVPEVSALMLLTVFTGVYSLVGAFHSRYRLPLELGLFILAAGTVKPYIEALAVRWTAPARTR